MLNTLTSGLDRRALGTLVGLILVIGLLWDTVLVYPIKVLVVFFHELSHGLAAVLTGGSIVKIELSAAQGGLCVTRGGSRFLTLTAGYLGSLLWGGAILLSAAHTRWDRWIAGALGALVISITIIFVRPLLGFGVLFGLCAGAALILSGWKLSEQINDTLLRLIGLTSCLYAPLDIKSDILDRPHLRSDAVMLGELTGIPGVAWGVVWIVVALVVASGFLLLAGRRAAHE